MKKIFFLLFGLLPLLSFAQLSLDNYFPIKDSVIEYDGVLYLNSELSPQHLFDNARNWVDNAFFPSTTIIKTEDRQAGRLIVQSYVVNGSGNYIQDHKIWFSMLMEFDKGECHYTIKNLNSKFLGYFKRYNGPIENWIPRSYNDYVERYMGAKKIEKCQREYVAFFKSLDSDFKNIIFTLNASLAAEH